MYSTKQSRPVQQAQSPKQKGKWWEYKGIGLKRFLKRPRFTVWKVGIIIGIFLIVVFWNILSSIIYSKCGINISGIYCRVFYLLLFVIVCMICGMFLTYIAKIIMVKIKSRNKGIDT